MRAAAGRERLLVVGNGMASVRLLERLAEHAPGRFDLTVVGAEPAPGYNRVLLSSLLAGDVTGADCALRDAEWYALHGFGLLVGERVDALDLRARNATLASGRDLAFDRIVLATGSSPIRLPNPGMDLPGVIAFRDLADVGRMQTLPPRARAVVIGGGLLGLEAAYGLARRGVSVTLLHIMDRLMERQLDGKAAALVQRAMERLGIAVLLGAKTEAVEGAAHAEAVRLADGRVLPCDLVVVAAGVRANAQLAQHAGVACGRGILVDDEMTTDHPGVYALGECAEHRGQCYGLVEPAYEQAETLARTLSGRAATYEGSHLATSLKVSGVPVFSAGEVMDEAGTERILLSDPKRGVYRKLALRDGRLVGALLVGDVADSHWYRALIRTGETVTDFRSGLMFGRGAKRPETRQLAA